MIPPAENAAAYLENRALLLLLVGVTLALGWILLPFYGTILWGAIIALVFAPVYRRLLPWLKNRHTPAALLTVLVAVVILVVPFALVSAALAREAMLVYERVHSGEWNPALYLHRMFDALPTVVMAQLDRFGLADFDTLQRRLTTAVVQGSQFIATRALGIGQDTFEFVAEVREAVKGTARTARNAGRASVGSARRRRSGRAPSCT